MKYRLKRAFKNKKIFKLSSIDCKICGEERYDLLDVHRIKKGKYEVTNCVCLCTSCHRLAHSGKIRIMGWVHSSKGNLLHYFDENGKEYFK